MTPQSGDSAPPDILILGAGIAGLYSAKRFVEAGLRVHVIEKTSFCGGPHQSRNIGPYTFDYGSIFYEENSSLFDLAEGLRELCPQQRRKQRRISPDGTIQHYPIDPRQLVRSSSKTLPIALADLLFSRVFVQPDGTLASIARKRLGRRLFERTGLANYIRRFNHKAPGELDEAFFYQRMSFVERSTRMGNLWRAGLRSIAPLNAAPANTRPPLRIRPYAGFFEIFDRIKAELESAGVRFHFGETVAAISGMQSGGFRVETDRATHEASQIASAMPLESLHHALFGESAGLLSLDMTTLFVSAEWLDPACGNVLFNFHEQGEWKRATIYSRLYPDAPTDRAFFGVEVTLDPENTVSPEAAYEDFVSHMQGLGLARGMRLEDHVLIPNAYPLLTVGTDARLKMALQRVEDAGILTLGRQGRFEYLPTSSGVIRRTRAELEAGPLRPSEGS